MAAAFDQSESDQLVLRRSPAQRRRMLLVTVPLMLLGFVALGLAFSTRAGLPLVILGVVLLAPMLWVLDQGYVEVQLTPNGLTIRRAGSRLSLSWDEVERFYVRKVPSVGGSGKIVSVKFRDQKPAGLVNRRALAGYIGSVGMDPDKEVELLESWRERQ